MIRSQSSGLGAFLMQTVCVFICLKSFLLLSTRPNTDHSKLNTKISFLYAKKVEAYIQEQCDIVERDHTQQLSTKWLSCKAVKEFSFQRSYTNRKSSLPNITQCTVCHFQLFVNRKNHQPALLQCKGSNRSQLINDLLILNT